VGFFKKGYKLIYLQNKLTDIESKFMVTTEENDEQMSLAGNGNVMRLVADVYLSAGKRKKKKREKKKKSSKGCQAEKYLTSTAKVNRSRIFLKKAAI